MDITESAAGCQLADNGKPSRYAIKDEAIAAGLREAGEVWVYDGIGRIIQAFSQRSSAGQWDACKDGE